jgi:two-component system LytT family response regulator
VIRALVADDEWAARAKLATWLAEQGDFEVVAQPEDGLAAANALAGDAIDVAFLDIQMPGLSGLELAAQLDPSTAPLLVFVTAFDEHAIKAFELNAIDYLLKPYDRDRLLQTLTRIRARCADRSARAQAVALARVQTGSSGRLLVPDRHGSLRLIDSASIDWLEADDNHVHVHAGPRVYLLRRTLQDLIEQLGDRRFARIHKSAAVNVAAVASLSPLFKGDHEVQLRTGQTLRLSRRYKDALFARVSQGPP